MTRPIYRFGDGLLGFGIGLVFVVILVLLLGTEEARNYCPAILEHAPDTLAVVQEFPACLKFTEAPE